MSRKIIADPEVLQLVTNARPGNKSIYVNMDAIRELPDEYEAILSKVTFDEKNLAKDFSDVGGGNWMPQPSLMYRIADARGIEGGDKSTTEPVIETVDINPLLMKPLGTPATLQQMIVGRRVSKFSTVLEEDGKQRRSSLCTVIYNVWERCLEVWAAEEVETDGYKKINDKTKYHTPARRQLHFQKEMKFAHPKAETKAHEKTIRELAGMMTGYKAVDLQSGYMIFSRVRRSSDSMKAETAARLAAILGGAAAPALPPVFGDQAPTTEAPAPVRHVEEAASFDTTPPPPPPTLTKRQQMINVLREYVQVGAISQDNRPAADAMIKWLLATPEAESDTDFWPKCLKNLAIFEKKIPENVRVKHNIL